MVARGGDAIAALAQRRQLEAVRNMSGRLAVTAPYAIARGAASVFDALDPMVRTLAQALATQGLPKAQMKAVNQKIAEAAQRAMVVGYKSTLPLNSPGYRPGQRLVNVLEEVLANEAMTAKTTDRVISFVNQPYLDSRAAHWYRVNYGVAGETTQGPSKEARTFVVSVNGVEVVQLRDRNPKRQGGIFLPHRFRWNGVKLVPLSKVKTRPDGKPGRSAISYRRGSRAAHFTDLGLQAVAANAGPAYEQVMRQHLRTKRGQKVMSRREIVIPEMRMIPNGNWTVRIR